MKDQTDKVNQYIKKRLRSLVKELGVNKTNFGRFLVSFKKEPAQQSFLRAKRLIDGEGSIKVETLIKITHFFDKPLEYFLPELQNTHTLSSPEKKTKITQKSFDEIRINLQKLGFDNDFIENQILQLKAMQDFQNKED